ncbi:lipopolysaccharide biosynthesis protein [Rhizobacter sp. OV335]|jgi:O-antigen/teichoic acid export membrane protein|uniref:lipopolysaccharide biosynthesis protein n=1 Tax=Rhizobacter sp. OV335 TaxID=1500264 RepID=UPI000919B032|nr:oligosaccharide flippase family protein [Rhizobacter sp. OV335]SHL95604.1 Membrane protein involved in the export of O-antigen and teichoic acid [Rhizobacter sp. OV335]
MSAVNRNLFANYVGQGWTALINLAIIPVYIALLGMESYGLVGIFAIVQTCFAALDAGMTPTLNREMARYAAGSHTAQSITDLVRSIEVLCGVLLLALICFGLLSADWIARHGIGTNSLPHGTVANALRLIAVVAALRMAEGIYRGAILGLQRQVWLNASTAGLATLRAAGAVAILKWVEPSVGAFFAWQAIVSLLAVVVFARTTHQALPRAKARFSLPALSGVKGFAGGIVGTSLLALALSQFDKLLLARLLPLESFARYSLAATVANSLYQLVNPVAQAYYPRLTELATLEDRSGLASSYHTGAQLLAVAVLPAAMLLIVMGEPILKLWTADSTLSTSTAPLLALLAAGCLFNGVMHMPYMLQLAHGWSSFAFRTNLISAVIYVPALLLATRHHGAIGAASCWLALNLLVVLISVPFMHRRLLPLEMGRWYTQDLLLPLACVAVTVVSLGRIGLTGMTESLQAAYLVTIGAMAMAVCVLASSRLRHGMALRLRRLVQRP